MFTVELLPAGRGDCLWIEYGDPAAPWRILVDGGIGATGSVLRERILALPEGQRRFELVVVTHIDVDHIGGIVKLLADRPPGLQVEDVWFNGRRHLEPPTDFLGVSDARRLTEVLNLQTLAWNAAFGGGAVVVPESGALPTRRLCGGLALTVLGPTPDRLMALAPRWDAELNNQAPPEPEPLASSGEEENEFLSAGGLDVRSLAATRFLRDPSLPNGSSIALLVEYSGKRLLLAGDAYAGDLLAATKVLASAAGERRLAIDALKLSHHGGHKSTSVELLEALACRRFLFSSDGTRFGHPQPEAVARVICHGRVMGAPELHFNYRSESNGIWNDAELFGALDLGYTPVWPEAGGVGLKVEL